MPSGTGRDVNLVIFCYFCKPFVTNLSPTALPVPGCAGASLEARLGRSRSQFRREENPPGSLDEQQIKTPNTLLG